MKTRLVEHLVEGRPNFCIGVDPHFFLDPSKKDDVKIHNLFKEFVAGTLKKLRPKVNLIKFQSAFFEAGGIAGQQILNDLMALAHDLGFYTILDWKRSDIDSTLQAYLLAGYQGYGADALTLIPWYHLEKALSEIDQLQKAALIVTVGSDPASWPMQASALHQYCQHSSIQNLSSGLVIGANYLTHLRDTPKLLEQLKNLIILAPGVGAQKAEQDPYFIETIQQFKYLIFPISRGIIHPFLKGLGKDLPGEISEAVNSFDRFYLELNR